jgi:hypothetical protein
MYLYAQVSVGVNEFDKQGELVAKALVVSLTYEGFFFFANEFVDVLPFAECLATGNARKQPALGAPNKGFKKGSEFVVFHMNINFLSRKRG